MFPNKLFQFCLKNRAPLYKSIRNHFNQHYKPGIYPKTLEERIAAAKKYNLNLEDYLPYPDNGTGLGDYPKLPNISADSRDDNYPWDCPELKRNFEEPMHLETDLFSDDRYDISYKFRVPLRMQAFQFFAVLAAFYVVYYLLEGVKQFPALAPKQFPHQGKEHYLYEPKQTKQKHH